MNDADGNEFSRESLEKHFLHLRKRDFPSLESPNRSIYLDSAATSLKPVQVVEALSKFYLHDYGTVHRAIYSRAQVATEMYDEARLKVTRFLGLQDPSEVIFTKGTTDGINIIAEALAESDLLGPKKTIIISEMEHHSNIVPWQIVAQRTGAKLAVLPISTNGPNPDQLDLKILEEILTQNDVAIVSLTHCSNILGTINPISEISELTHKHGAYLFVDGAQSAPHMPINLTTLGADFFAFSSHKMSGPTGIGVLWGRRKLLDILTPSRGGGDMIDTVTFQKTTYAEPPLKFEPGTPPIGEAIALGHAITYLQEECRGMEMISAWEHELTVYLREKLAAVSPRIEFIGNAFPLRGSLQSFIVQGAHPLDVATMLDLRGVAVRSGHLCGQPVLKTYGVTSLLRASIAYYNTKEDIDIFIDALKEILLTL